jgi:WhiB family transcriptional regulator, redox-sensing transcriptional regulator
MVFLRQLNSPPAVPGVDFDPTLARRGELDWAQRAACRGQTTLFFPAPAERPGARELREAQARALCLACPVLEQCRARARQQHEYGFWGGETEEERAAAGYPVALPVGQVARRIRVLRQAALTAVPRSGIGP